MVLCFQVYKISIGAACGLSWPSDRLVIQVLDDSTDPTIKVIPHIPFHLILATKTCKRYCVSLLMRHGSFRAFTALVEPSMCLLECQTK